MLLRDSGGDAGDMQNNEQEVPPPPPPDPNLGSDTPSGSTAPSDVTAPSPTDTSGSPAETAGWTSGQPAGAVSDTPGSIPGQHAQQAGGQPQPSAPYPYGAYPSGPYAAGPYAAGPYAPGQYGSTGQPGSGSWPSADPAASAYPTTTATLPGPNPAYAAGGGYPPVRNRLTRSQDNRVVGGVLGGLARYWNTDPLLLRILTIVLTIATGGALLLGYIIAWIVIPLETSPPSGWPGTGTGYAAGGNPAYGSPGSDPTGGAQAAASPRPPRSYLGWLVVSVGLVLAGVLGVIGLFAQPTASFVAISCSVVLIVLGAGLIVGAWYGRARWLTVLAVPMVFITMAAVATTSWVQSPAADRWMASEDGGISVGDRLWTVTPADLESQPLDYRVTAGDAVLDLRQLTALGGSEPGRPLQRVTITSGVGLGQLTVRIPADMQLNLTATVRAGEVQLPALVDPAPPAGVGPLPDPAIPERSGTDLDVQTTIQPLTEAQAAYVVDLDAAIGAGSLEVRREAS